MASLAGIADACDSYHSLAVFAPHLHNRDHSIRLSGGGPPGPAAQLTPRMTHAAEETSAAHRRPARPESIIMLRPRLELTANLRHSNILPLYDSGEADTLLQI